MQTALEFLVHILLAITGALGVATLWVGAMALLAGCGVIGTGWCWRTVRQRGRLRAQDRARRDK